MIALTLAGAGDAQTIPTPDGTPMSIASATAKTQHAGACPASPAAPVPSPSATVRINFRVLARDDANYTVAVFLDTGEGQLPFRLGEVPAPGYGFGFAAPVYSLTWVDGSNGYIDFTYTGYVEDGVVAPKTVNWTFLVGLLPGQNNQASLLIGDLLSTVRVPWAKTYGTCG